MSKYTTVEGHEIIRDGEYENRDGGKVTVLGFTDNVEHSVIGVCLGIAEDWGHDGRHYDYYCNYSGYDLMRPWKEEPKRYDLKDMYMGSYIGHRHNGLYRTPPFHTQKEVLAYSNENAMELIAITKADATGFYEGEGVDD